ncbi:MAG: hypothetical protein HXY29_13340 [Rhodocyclaceae bacterium]|jgi:tRNA A37 threonylcarbamoyladenosine synthetase subunit TsaC/SUA5/YrdC|nr:hypothetical protein [Rhodocyclaceae bacterium]
MRRLQSFLLILIALWLPLQAAAAVTMPFCRHAPKPLAETSAHCHEEAAEQTAPAIAGDLDCDNCSLCHLACTGFLLANTVVTPAALAANILVPGPQLAQASHIPEPPQQPPRR